LWHSIIRNRRPKVGIQKLHIFLITSANTLFHVLMDRGFVT